MTLSKNKAVVIRFNEKFLAQGNFDILKEIVADDFINRTAVAPIPDNVEGLKQL